MQPPTTPTSNRRSHFPSSRQSFSAGSAAKPRRYQSRQNSFLRLFIGALAITASKTWVIDNHGGEGGGAGWLVLAYWASRVFVEGKQVWDGRRRKAFRLDATSNGIGVKDYILSSFNYVLQSLAFFMSLGSLGPFKTSIIGMTGSLLATAQPTTIRSFGPLLPLILASGYAFAQQLLLKDFQAVIVILVFALTTSVIQGRFLEPKTAGSRETIDGRHSLYRTILSALVATVSVIALYFMGFIPIPVPVSSTASQRFGSFVAAFLVSNIPLSFGQNSPSSAGLRLKTWRDKATFLTCIPILQFFALHPIPTTVDVVILLPISVFSIWAESIFKAQPELAPSWTFSNHNLSTANHSWSFLSLVPSRWRPHFQTIISTPTSSRIFYFLLLNLAYMGVQMGYGVFTNSLGLISDAIHMLFDCLGLGVGLWASVAAMWKPDGRYTFGYSRVETLSGFANGCFLILISVFIIFEAIQRVYNPPEMETHQLLLVSGIGLAINLWGMWATGGHHHHGHSHGHDHAQVHAAPKVEVHKQGVSQNDAHKYEDHHLDLHSHDHHHKPSASSKVSPRPASKLQKRKSSGQLKDSGPSATTPQKTNNGHNHDEHCSHDGEKHSHSHNHHKLTHESSTHNDAHAHEDDYDHAHAHGHGHDHDRGHDHAHSHNMRGVFLHVLADTLGSVGVIISTILIRFTGWTGFDPIASLFIAALIMASVIPLVVDSGRILCLDVGEEKESEIRSALTELSSVDGLASYAAPRFWPRCEGELVGSIHIQLAPSPSSFDPTRLSTPPSSSRPRKGDAIYANSEKVVGRVEKVLKKRIKGLTELVVQVEGSEERSFCTCMTGGDQ
ncbi:cation:cation antiporter, putative [Cryptococcus deneoformans JEC21]|uniref:Cation:cation antiporter, putative n=1 Tax=Cryptococcus deneoformans (strain JEC21 / ATCC MYA-565) TaxID=214684 RepID=Q5KCD4_CRYD1|nr:cation:cation antiporter, putative [Cryptococcus neoformans var. neoformans JEC21]AAW44947.2 cation:cation antiporter, putative [Cryptococcus neoformans var. neoformans JEC21]